MRWVASDHSIFDVHLVRVLLGARKGGDMSTERDRVISITLTEAEWHAFLERHPEPVHWLRDRIRDEVRGPQDDEEAQPAA